MRTFVVFALITLSTLSASAQSLLRDGGIFRSFVDTTEQVLGGTVRLHVHAAPGANLSWNDSLSTAVPLNTIYDTTSPGIHLIRTFLLLDTGEVLLPVCQAQFEGNRYAMEPQRVMVKLLADQQENSAAPDRPLAIVPVKLWWWFLHYWMYFAAALGGLVLAFVLRRYFKNRKTQSAAPPEIAPRDFYTEAVQGLQKLREERSWERDEKGFYVALGDLVRVYLSHRTGLPLSEQTTSESLTMLHGKWTGSQLDAYSFIMMRADIVKFARGKMDVSEHMDCLDRASRLISEFKPSTDVA